MSGIYRTGRSKSEQVNEYAVGVMFPVNDVNWIGFGCYSSDLKNAINGNSIEETPLLTMLL